MAIVAPFPMSPPLTPSANGARTARGVVGLSSDEAQRRLIEFGLNENHRERATSPLALRPRREGA